MMHDDDGLRDEHSTGERETQDDKETDEPGPPVEAAEKQNPDICPDEKRQRPSRPADGASRHAAGYCERQ
jgi:hypothetical protein